MFEHPLVTVGGLIVAPDGEILLVRSKKWNDYYSLPGGKVEWGETRQDAFIREVKEETALRITNLRFAIVQDCIFSTEFWQKKHFVMHDFIADLDPTCAKDQVKLNNEAYDYRWISPKNALALSLHRECRLLIEWYQANYLSKLAIIGIHQYRLDCIVGILPTERQQQQTLLIDAKIKVDISSCLFSEEVGHTVDYRLLVKLCQELAHLNKYFLLENFANEFLDECLSRFQAAWAWIRIQKPSAIAGADYAYVELEREG